MTAGTSSPRGVVGIAERRKSKQAIDGKRVRLIDDAIDFTERTDLRAAYAAFGDLAALIEAPDYPQSAEDILTAVEAAIPRVHRLLLAAHDAHPDLLKTLERLRELKS